MDLILQSCLIGPVDTPLFSKRKTKMPPFKAIENHRRQQESIIFEEEPKEGDMVTGTS